MVTEEERKELLSLVQTAGAKLVELWPGNPERQSKTPLRTQDKDDGSLVTEADFASNEIIVEGLRKLFPNDGIYSEEIPPDKDLGEKEFVWVLDPLDGTKYFAAGHEQFAVLLTRCQRGRAVLGVIYLPVSDELVYGEVGRGVERNGAQVVLPKLSEARSGRVLARHCRLQAGALEYESDPGAPEALLLLLEDRLDGVVTRVTTHGEWDLAPFVAIAEALEMNAVTEDGTLPTFFFRGGVSFQKLVLTRFPLVDGAL